MHSFDIVYIIIVINFIFDFFDNYFLNFLYALVQVVPAVFSYYFQSILLLFHFI